jgi:hypothetical protein
VAGGGASAAGGGVGVRDQWDQRARHPGSRTRDRCGRRTAARRGPGRVRGCPSRPGAGRGAAPGGRCGRRRRAGAVGGVG